MRLLFAGYTITAVPEPLYWYRLQESSMRSTMSGYDSAQIILEEFRRAMPPALRPLPGLAYGQSVVMKNRAQEFTAELDLRERVLWLAEERLKRSVSAGVHGTGRNSAKDSDMNVRPRSPRVQRVSDVVRSGLLASFRGVRQLPVVLASARQRRT